MGDREVANAELTDDAPAREVRQDAGIFHRNPRRQGDRQDGRDSVAGPRDIMHGDWSSR